MTKSDIHDLKVWKANLEIIVEEEKIKLGSLKKILRYAKAHPEIICKITFYEEAEPGIIQKIIHLQKTIEEINQILEVYNEVKRINNYKGITKQKAGLSQDNEWDKFIQLQRTPSLLAN
jgi:F0F1-type ATP synthase delta subunit